MPEQVDAALAALPAKMAATLQAIKPAAPKAQVVVLPYLPRDARFGDPVPAQRADRRHGPRASSWTSASKLYAVIKQSAADAKVDFVDSYAPKGHDACAAPGSPLGRGPGARLPRLHVPSRTRPG